MTYPLTPHDVVAHTALTGWTPKVVPKRGSPVKATVGYTEREHPLGRVGVTLEDGLVVAARLNVDDSHHDAVLEPHRCWDARHGEWVAGVDYAVRIRRFLDGLRAERAS